ncbi:MAG: hypothetical protein WAX80_00540 [Minisyncoccia bacterium]
MTVASLLRAISAYILNPLILLAFSVAFLVFFWGVFQFISSQTVDSGREEGKRKIFWGIFGMFIMLSAFALIRLILNTFGIPTSTSYISF